MANLTKEEIQSAMTLEGHVRGIVFQSDMVYVHEKWGEEGANQLKQLAQTLQISMPYDDKDSTYIWYPVGLRVASILLIKAQFGLSDEQVKEFGYAAPAVSLFVKLSMKFFGQMNLFISQAPKFWKKHYDIGELEVSYFNEQERKLCLRLTNIRLHPVFAIYLNGYFKRILQLVQKNANSHQTHSTNAGDAFEEYEYTW